MSNLNTYVITNISVQSKPVSLTIPKQMLEKIDESRGDVSRSRYVLRLIEKAYDAKDAQVKEVED